MSDEYNQNNTPIEAQSSETMGSSGSTKDIDYVRPAETSRARSLSWHIAG